MRNSSGCFDGLPDCKSAAMPNCSSHACSIWRTANRTSKPADDFCVPGFRGAMPAYVEHRVNWRNLDGFTEKSSVTPAGDCAATEWKLPRIVIQTSETVRLEGVSYTGHGVPRMDTVSRTGQSRPHKQNTQEGGSRAHARTRSGTLVRGDAPAYPVQSGFRSKDAWAKFKPSLLRLVGRKKGRGAKRSLPSNAATMLP